MKKLLALLLALMMALGCAAASAETVYVKLNVNRDTVNALTASFGMPEDQAAIVDPILAAVNALGVKVTTVNDGAQIDLDLNGDEALSLGVATNEEGFTAVSTLFPNYALTMKTETITQMMESMMAAMPGAAGGEGGMDINAMMAPLAGYFTRFFEACSAAAVPGEPVPGEYEFEGYKFDTLVPVTVNVPAIAENAKALLDEMLSDEAVLSAIQGMAQGMAQGAGGALNVEDIKKAAEEWIAHFPETVNAEYYANSDGSPAFYLKGEAAYEGQEPSFGYTMLFIDQQNMNMKYWDSNSQMTGAIVIAANSFRMEFSMAGMVFALDFIMNMGTPAEFLCKLYFMDLATPLLTVAVTVAPEGERTLPMDTEGKTVLPIEGMMNGESEAGNALVMDIMTNGLNELMPKLTKAVPEIQDLINLMMVSPAAESPEREASAKQVLQLGTSGYTLLVDESFEAGELTQEDIDDDMVAYLRSPNTLLDFDVYQFSKEGYPAALEDFTAQEAEEYGALSVTTGMLINGIPAAMYIADETYEDQSYQTATYVLEDGDQYLEITFWLDGEDAYAEAVEIMGTLAYEAQEEEQPSSPIAGDWAVNYFGIPMYFYFDEDGTFLGVLADRTVPVADDGNNTISGAWTLEGDKMYMYVEDEGETNVTIFDWDGETLSTVVEGTEIVMVRPIEPENAE